MGNKHCDLSGFWGKFKLVVSPHKVKFRFENTLLPLMLWVISSTVGIRCRALRIASFALCMSMQRRMSPPDFETTTIGLTHGVGPCAGSIMSSSMSSLIFPFNFGLMLNGVLAIFAAPPLGFLWPLVCFCLFYHPSALSYNALENVLPAHIDDRIDFLLDSWNLDRDVPSYHISNKFSHGQFWYPVPRPLFVPSMRFTLAEFSPFSSMVIAASCVSPFSQFSAISSALAKVRP